jgi:hypothetical protein
VGASDRRRSPPGVVRLTSFGTWMDSADLRAIREESRSRADEYRPINQASAVDSAPLPQNTLSSATADGISAPTTRGP